MRNAASLGARDAAVRQRPRLRAAHAARSDPGCVPAFRPDVSDDEWNAAIPAKDSNIAAPRLVRGPAGFDIRAVLKRGESARIAVAHIIRANGTVGVYRITTSTNPDVTSKVIEMLRAQMYEPPLLLGSPVSVRGEVTYQFAR